MNSNRKGILLGWASCDMAEARAALIRAAINLDEAGYSPAENLAELVEDVLWLDEMVTGLADEYAARASHSLHLPSRKAA